MPRSPEDTKMVVVTAPAAIVDDASLTTNVIDTRGYGECLVSVILGATDIALTACKLQEADAASDATTLTSGADVTGAIYGTSTDASGAVVALPTATDDGKIFTFRVKCGGSRKRYLKPVVTFGNGTSGGFATVIAMLSKASILPNSNTEKGIGGTLQV